MAAAGIAGTAGTAAALSSQQTLENPDLSWMEQTEEVNQDVEEQANDMGEDEAAKALHAQMLEQAGKDLFGEDGNDRADAEAMMDAEAANELNPVEVGQEFETGPPIPYKGGMFTATILGHRKLQDSQWGDEYTEYVLRCTWGRSVIETSKTTWLVGGRYNDFNALHQELKRAAAAQENTKRASWFPRFPKRHVFSTLLGKNQREPFIQKREKELNKYFTSVLTKMPDALMNIHMDRFLNLSLRTQEICDREAYAEARKRWDEEEREALAAQADAEPLTQEELQDVESLTKELLEKVLYATSENLETDTQLQEMIHSVKLVKPRVEASALIGGKNVDSELVPLAMQLQDDIQEAMNQYHDAVLAHRLHHS